MAPADPDLVATGVTLLRDALPTQLAGAGSVEDAAQRFAVHVHRQWMGAVALVRVYATVPCRDLPAAERAFAERALAPGAGPLPPGALVLTLLGTRGAEPAWNRRQSSKNHLAIPLLDSAQVDGIPMIARMLAELGLELQVAPSGDGMLVRRHVGGINSVFFVPEPATATDGRGRRIIPDLDFVTSQGVRTVVGMGGSYLDGTALVAIVFFRDRLPRLSAERMGTLIGPLKLATSRLISVRRFFEGARAPDAAR